MALRRFGTLFTGRLVLRPPSGVLGCGVGPAATVLPPGHGRSRSPTEMCERFRPVVTRRELRCVPWSQILLIFRYRG
jgi:hypothetical protein